MSIDKFAGSGAKRGLVIVITGNGKGKTTSAFGQALRATGQGYRVCIVQFMKGRAYGEVLAVQKYLPTIQLLQFGLDSFVMRDNPAPVDVEMARQGLEKAKEVINSGDFDMVILDEINVAMFFGLISPLEVLSVLRKRRTGVEVILTGRNAPAEIIEEADLVTRMVAEKHPYDRGVIARAGIEF